MSAASLALGLKKQDMATEIFHDALKWATSNAETAAAEARQYKTVQQWQGTYGPGSAGGRRYVGHPRTARGRHVLSSPTCSI